MLRHGVDLVVIWILGFDGRLMFMCTKWVALWGRGEWGLILPMRIVAGIFWRARSVRLIVSCRAGWEEAVLLVHGTERDLSIA